jgi:hypothetical protein
MSPKLNQKYHVIDDHVYTRYDVHSFTMGDVDDLDIYIAQPIYEWQQTPKGQWVMKHCKDPTYHTYADHLSFGYKILITAYMTPKRYTEFALKFL